MGCQWVGWSLRILGVPQIRSPQCVQYGRGFFAYLSSFQYPGPQTPSQGHAIIIFVPSFGAVSIGNHAPNPSSNADAAQSVLLAMVVVCSVITLAPFRGAQRRLTLR